MSLRTQTGDLVSVVGLINIFFNVAHVMEQINSQEFNKYVELLKGIFPGHKKYLESARLVFFPASEKNNNPSILLYTDNGKVCNFIIRTASSGLSIICDSSTSFYMAKMLFISLVVEKIRYQDLAKFFLESIQSIYRYTDFEKESDYQVIEYSEISFDTGSSIFSVTARMNRLIFCEDDADISKINPKNNFSGKTIYFCKNGPLGSFRRENLMGMLKLDPPFSFSTKLYKMALKSEYVDIFKAIDLFRAGETNIPYSLKRDLANCNLSDGKDYEEICFRVLDYLFCDSFEEFSLKEQVPSEGRIRIRDFIIDNASPKIDFFKNLKRDGCKLILFDAKNYCNELTPANLDTFKSYIAENRFFGRFGIILSRKGASSSLKTIIRERMIAKIDEILVLTEVDIISMIDLRASGRNAEVYLQNKLNELRLST